MNFLVSKQSLDPRFCEHSCEFPHYSILFSAFLIIPWLFDFMIWWDNTSENPKPVGRVCSYTTQANRDILRATLGSQTHISLPRCFLLLTMPSSSLSAWRLKSATFLQSFCKGRTGNFLKIFKEAAYLKEILWGGNKFLSKKAKLLLGSERH